MVRPQLLLDLHAEMIVDNFAGGGGASTGIERALGRCVDVAINHNPQAVAMHQANHPQTLHLQEDVFAVDPAAVTRGRPVGLAWFSPDCTHFSKAKGGKPRCKKIRGLAWVMAKWAATVRPRVMVLENVEEFTTWGPLLGDGTPCPKRKGNTFKSFVKRLLNLGYAVEWRELRACNYGAPTIRKRLFLVARCDGRPIAWPAATHGDPAKPETKRYKLKPWRTAAECINWSLPCPSIFLTPEEARKVRAKRPLAEATQRRIARGIFKFVVGAKRPFIVRCAHGEVSPGGVKRWGSGVHSVEEPLPTLTGSKDCALVSPFVTECANGSSPRVFAADEPLRTQCAEVKGGHFALVAAFLAKHFSGEQLHASSAEAPLPTVTARDHNALVASHLTKFYGTATGQDLREPIHAITAQCAGGHHAEVRAFLIKYYGQGGQLSSVNDPMHTVTVNDRMGLVTVDGHDYLIDDIGMRMLKPRELFAGQGFPADYVITPVVNGKPLTEECQVRACGNSVPPPLAQAIAAANVPELSVWGKREKGRAA